MIPGGMRVEARGHLIDSGLLSRAFDAVLKCGGTYRVVAFEVGRTPEEESRVVLEVMAAGDTALDEIVENLGSLGFSLPEANDARLGEVARPGVAPDGFYSTTNLPTRVRVGGKFLPVSDQRMDSVIVVAGGEARCVKLRDLEGGDRVVLGHDGIQVRPDTKERTSGDFAFMASGISSERRVERQVGLLADLWQRTKRDGGRVVVVAGPVVVHAGQAGSMAALIEAGFVDAFLAGNALAVHDIEAAIYGTSLGVQLETGQPVMHGHMHHMRAINLVRAAGGIEATVRSGRLQGGIMHALIKSDVPFSLAGSIRDDGPLPETEMDLFRAQERYAELVAGAGLVVVLGTMLHGIGVGNMLPATVHFVCVDINPAVASKLADRGSAHSIPIVTDVGLFLALLKDAVLGRRAGE